MTSTSLVATSASLFERLGGSSGIRAIVDRVVARHMDNPLIQARFRPYLETEKLEVIKQHLCAFLEAGSGGSAQYVGRSMPDAHRGMNINGAEYLSAMDDIMAALQDQGVDEQTRKDVLAIAFALKGDIIHI